MQAWGAGDEAGNWFRQVRLDTSYWRTGDFDRALDAGERALAGARTPDDALPRTLANFYVGMVRHNRGDYRDAVASFSANVMALDKALRRVQFGHFYPWVFSCGSLAWSLAELGRFDEAIRHAQAGDATAAELGHEYSRSWTSCNLGLAYLRQGELRLATAALERALNICRRAETPATFPLIAASLGLALSLAGRTTEGLALLEQAVEKGFAIRMMPGQSMRVAALGEGYLLVGRLDEATGAARRALELAGERTQRGDEAYALRLLGEIASAADPPDVGNGVAFYMRACAVADELGMRPLAAHCQFGVGRLYERAGMRRRARDHLVAAAAAYKAMGMRAWMMKIEAELQG